MTFLIEVESWEGLAAAGVSRVSYRIFREWVPWTQSVDTLEKKKKKKI